MAAPTATEGTLLILPPECTRNPCLCQRQYLSKEEQEAGKRYGGRLSMSDGQTFLTHHLQSIRNKQAEVLSMLGGREDAIIKRCRKKSRLQWAAFLCSHWPYQPTRSFEQTFVDFFCSRKASPHTQDNTAVFQTPQLEYELLKSDYMPFLGLVYYRSAFPVEDWVVNDNGLVTKVWKDMSSSVTYIDGVVPICGADFCRLRPYNDIEVHEQHLLAGHLALRYLESFDIVIDFVYRSMTELTSDLCRSSGEKEWSRLLTRNFLRDQESRYSITFMDTHPTAPQHNLDALLALIRVQAEKQSNDLRRLQTDILYFRDRLQSVNAGADSTLIMEPHGRFENVFSYKAESVLIWSSFVQMFEELLNSSALQEEELRRGASPLLPPAAMYMQTFMLAVEGALHGLGDRIMDIMFATKYFSRRLTTSHLCRKTPLHTQLGFKSKADYFQEEPVMAHICELAEWPTHWPVILHRIFEMLQKNKALQQDLPLLILDTIWEMGSIWKLYEFTRSQYVRYPLDDQATLVDYSLLVFQFFGAAAKAEQGQEFKPDGTLDQAAARIRPPTHSGRKDAAWLRTADEMQLRLALTFELGVEAWIGRLVDGGLENKCTHLLRSLLISQPQVTLYPVSDEERRRLLSQSSESTPIRKAVAEADFVPLVQTPEERFIKPRAEKSAKANRHPAEGTLQLHSLTATDSESEKEPEPATPIPVPRKLAHVVAHLFGSGPPEGKVTMADMVGLMECAGFEANHLPSSELHFTRVTGEPRGSICIHSHHGESRFRKNQLDNLARRLRRRFRWEEGTFLLGSGDAQAAG